MPDNAPVFRSAKLEELTALAKGWGEGARPDTSQIASWTTHQLLVWLQQLPRELDHGSLRWLDAAFALSGRGNYEILVEWLTIAAGSDYEPAFARVREVLLTVAPLPRLPQRGGGGDAGVARRREQAATSSRARRAVAASARKAASSRTAMSARFFRSTSTPASLSPCIMRL
jgi:hypothetical protein